ncbi:hypothetical protein MRX96_020056 [Rhipicephalus microplus]
MRAFLYSAGNAGSCEEVLPSDVASPVVAQEHQLSSMQDETTEGLQVESLMEFIGYFFMEHMGQPPEFTDTLPLQLTMFSGGNGQAPHYTDRKAVVMSTLLQPSQRMPPLAMVHHVYD